MCERCWPDRKLMSKKSPCQGPEGGRQDSPVSRGRRAGTGDGLKLRTAAVLLVRHGRGKAEPGEDFGSTGIFVVPLEGAGLFCHHKQLFSTSYITHYLENCM